MGISPLELNGTIARTQDYSVIRQNEEQKSLLDQGHFQNQLDKELNEKPHQVNAQNNADYHQKKFDAKEEGSNHYSGNGGRRREGSDKDKDEKERPQAKAFMKGQSSFDVKI
ncbi:MAG: hypothetical protein J5537_04675 [Lachnospiraceae bacterium]|nr:hypothetical protein [Lachnospiraceae bacterium]